MKIATLASSVLPLAAAQRQTLTVAAGGGNKSSPLLYGSLYEDIYHSGDGGLYGELLRNRAFQGSQQNGRASLTRTTDFWHPIGNVELSVDQSAPFLSPQLSWSMRIDVPEGVTGIIGVENDGFWGFNVDHTKRYTVSFQLSGSYSGQIEAAFRNKLSGKKVASTSSNVQSSDVWTYINFPTFYPSESPENPNNTFEITFDGAQLAGRSIRVNLLSAFKQTYDDRYNGVREDLAQSYENLKTSWIRLPGGNNMQGPGFGYEWKWNETIGDLEARPGHLGVWGDINTDGFGILEQLQWCLDMNQTVVLGIFAGLHIGGDLVSEADLPPFVDMAMEELEFLTGATSTRLGALRASLGHPQPFRIDHIEIGNEDYLGGGNASYYQYRFRMFYDRIKAEYPNINLISSTIPAPIQTPGTWIDLHIYQNQDFFAGMYDAFDQTDRNFPVIIGEYACIYAHNDGGSEIGSQTMGMALAEGIMLLGAERNSDAIRGTSYGALIKHYDEEPDTVSVIKHTASQILQTTSYYVQKIFAENHGEETVEVNTEFGEGIGPVFWSATKTGSKRFLKLVNYYGPGSVVDVVFQGSFATTADIVTLTTPACDSTNNLPQLGGEATVVTRSTLDSVNGRFTVSFGAPCELKVLIA